MTAPPLKAHRPARLAAIVALAAVYFLTASFGLSLGVAEQVTAIWPPTGIALAALLAFGTSLWPGIWVGALVANLAASEPLGTALGVATGNTLEALAGVWLLRRMGFDNSIERLRDVLALVLLAAIIATAIAATIGVTSLCLGNVQPWSRFGALWWVWWLGDAMGTLLVAPVLLSWHRWRPTAWRPARVAEFLCLLAGLMVTSHVVFSTPPVAPPHHNPYAYVVFPFVIWAALRFKQRGTSLAVLASSIMATWATARVMGPFGSARSGESLAYLQTYMGVVATTGLMLSAAISERNRVEKERARLLKGEQEARARAETLAQDLREQQEAKDSFLAMLGHELRNPLAPVRNGLEILRSRGGSEEALHLYEMMSRQVGHMGRLLDDLLDISRIQHGTITVQREPVELVGLVANSIEANRTKLDERQHRLTVAFPDEPLWLQGDPTRLEQIVSNLLTNAARYTPPGGDIAVILQRDDDMALLRVRDNGIGIRPELLPRIFEAFRQADRVAGNVQDGLGLGLTLVKKFAELHGGTVQASSAGPGLGSEFSVRLPLCASEGLRPEQQSPESVPLGAGTGPARRILVVDDNKDSAMTLAMMLSIEGHATEVAYDGFEALEKFRSFRPDSVFVDIGLPGGMDGHDLGKRILQESGPDAPFLVAVTGYGSPEDRQRSRAVGFDYHLVKPVDPRELTKIMQESGRLNDSGSVNA